MTDNSNIAEHAKILLIKDCTDEEFLLHLDTIKDIASMGAVTVLLPEDASLGFTDVHREIIVKTFPVNRSILQSFSVALTLYIWIMHSRFSSCLISVRVNLDCNQVLEKFLMLTNIPNVGIQNVNGEIKSLRSGSMLSWLMSLCKELMLSPLSFLFVWFGMSLLFAYFCLTVKRKRGSKLYQPVVQVGQHTKDAMRICLVSKEYPPITAGLGSFTWEMAHGLARLGHDVHVLTQGELEDSIREGNVTVHYFAPRNTSLFRYIKTAGFFESGNHLENSYWVSSKLKQLNDKFSFDVVEFSETRAEGLFYYLTGQKTPYVVRFHTSESFCHQLNAARPNLDRLWVRFMETFWIVKANAAIGISHDIVTKYCSLYDLDFSNVQIIPNPIGDSCQPLPTEVSRDNQVVLFVGRFELRKGPHILAKAIPLILERIPEVEFRYVGNDSGLKRYCEEILVESGVMQSVRIIEKIPRDEVYKHYAQATVCVFPSLWENFPYTCLEAMSMSRAVVASNTGGFPDIIKDGQSGLLVDPGDPDQLADAIVALLNNDELRNAIQVEATLRVRSLCDPIKVGQSTTDVYRSVVDKGGAANEI